MAQNVNRVIITANLTRDPELKTFGTLTVCNMRVACNGRVKDRETGQWTDKPNYFDVAAFGTQGENCSRYLTKGSPVAIDGRLDWREWTTDGGEKRQAVQIVADTVQFLDSRREGSESSFGGADSGFASAPPVSAAAAPADDDIPF